MSRGKLIFEASNLGPITSGKVDLRPLTVFVGHTNTGKSYMAAMIYSVMRYLKSCVNQLEYNKYTAQLTGKPNIEPGDREMFQKTVKIFKEGGIWSQHEDFDHLLKEKIASTMENKKSFLSELFRNYNIESQHDLIQKKSEKMRFRFESQNSRGEKLFSSDFELGDNLQISQYIKDTAASASDQSALNGEYNEAIKSSPLFGSKMKNDDKMIFYINKLINDLCFSHLKSRVPWIESQVHYLPATRCAVMQLSTFVNHSIVESVVNVGNGESRKQHMTGIIADFIKNIDFIRTRGGRSASWEDGNTISGQIEDRILKGKVTVSKEGGHLSQIRFAPRDWDDDLPMSRASSMIGELAPIVLYFRYFLEPGDLLILEEPEAHVHPDAQLDLIKEISEAVKKGVWVLLTTHSEWITEEIDKLIALSGYDDKYMRIRGRKLFALDKKDVGLWKFQENSMGCGFADIKEIGVEDMQDLGFQSSYFSIGNEFSAVHNKSQMDNFNSKTEGN